MVACALFGSGLDYANSVLYSSTKKNVSKLQKVQNLLARVVTSSFHLSSHSLLQQLHWLPVEYRINFKMANITLRSARRAALVAILRIIATRLVMQ